MGRKWLRGLPAVVLTLAVALLPGGCRVRPAPAPRPEAAGLSAGQIDPDLSARVARIASGVSGTGAVEALVAGELALIALDLGSPVPGGTDGQTITGGINDPDYPGSSPGGGPGTVQGPGGTTGFHTATPGGGFSAGGTSPGGTPNYTQAAPNGRGGLATQSPGGATPFPNPGSTGPAPLDIMTRVADRVRAEFAGIKAVRFAIIPADAVRLAQIAQAVRTGQPAAAFAAEINQLAVRALPAGTTEFAPDFPPQGEGPGPGEKRSGRP